LRDGEVDRAEHAGPGGDLVRSPFFWLSVATLGLASFIYYPVFFPPSAQGLAIQSEEFFFEANEAAGAPVLILSIWLFYRRSHYLDLLTRQGSPTAGLTLLLFAGALYVWGAYTRAPDLQLVSMISILFGLALFFGGAAAVRAYWLPILFLGFALPLPPVLLSAVMYPIQLVTAGYAGAILNGIGVASFVQGDQILRPENTFIVIETCSGVRTIVTLAMLTVLLIDLFERHGWHAAILFVAAPIVAFLSNGLRVVTLVLNPHSSIHSIHNLQGILMLLVGLTAMYFLDLGLERMLGSEEPPESLKSSERLPVSGRAGRAGVPKLLAVFGVLVVMLSATMFINPWQRQGVLEETPEELLGRVFGEGRAWKIDPDFQFRGSTRYLAHANQRLRVDGELMEVFLGIGNEQIRSNTLLTPRLSWPESGYARIEESTIQLENGGPSVRRTILRRGARSILSYAWYERNGSLVTEWFRNAAALDRSPLVRDEHMLAVRISTSLGSGGTGIDSADERILRVLRRLRPEFEQFAPSQPER
jgi:exosortase